MGKKIPLFANRQFTQGAVQCVTLGAAFLFLFGWAQPKAMAQVTILHSFGDGTVPNDGADPRGGLIQAADGNFYGVTRESADSTNQSTVFQMTTGASVTVINLLNKGDTALDPLLYAEGKLFGISYGGPPGDGALFVLTESAKGTWSRKDWYKFKRTGSDPSAPAGSLILGSNGDPYGVTEYGGSDIGGGTAYTVNFKTHALSVIHNFQGPALTDSPDTALLLATDGNFYGGTYGSGNTAGTIFKMSPKGKVSTFYTFSTSVLGGLFGPLIQGSDGNFYGVADIYLFQLTPDAVLTVLHTFGQGTDGGAPAGAVAQGPNGNLYGMCAAGGTAGYGTIYESSTDGSTYTVLHNFGDGSVPNDGQNPDGRLLLGADNNFYGVTENGGSAGKGTIFEVSP
jgi:uncharacterized repeat protein (TIGR03803 family)